jgi:hypothetical protein
MIDLTTVVFQDELPVLKLQAQSIALYCQDIGIRNIHVVVNQDQDLQDQIDVNWWGNLHDRVIIVPRSSFDTQFVENGWLSQQILKLLSAGMSHNVWTMVLDAKTIFVKPMMLTQLLDSQQRPQVGQLAVYAVFDRSRQIVNELFNIDLQRQLGPGGVPFVMNNQMVRELISEVEHCTATKFPEWFQAHGMLTEFILYSGYIQYRGLTDVLYNVDNNTIVPVNICHSEVESFDRMFQRMKDTRTLAVSIHRNAWKQLSGDQKQQYRDFLVSHGITTACDL